MLVYSKKIIQFLADIKKNIKNVISNEISLKVFGDRFYDKKQEFSYPIKIVIFNHKGLLGYFDSHFYELGFHESLMHSNKEQLLDLIRHELAHYMTFISYGEDIQPHGVEYRAFCQQMNWGEEVYKASACLENALDSSNEQESVILRKIQKLMALASSNNKNEAEQAMIKSQQLLLKHHMNSKYIPGDDNEEKIFLKRIMKQKKQNAKLRSIASILETFFVNIVYRKTRDSICLEVLGSSVNIEIAEYVANVLESELENFWNQAKHTTDLKGKIAKNSFFLGFAKGYCNKIHALKRGYHPDVTHALMVMEKKLADLKSLIYHRLSSVKSHASHCQQSSIVGEQMGRQFNINPGIQRSSKSSPLLLE